MPVRSPRFALNHMSAPGLRPDEFFALARRLGIEDVEIRNDLEGNAIADGTRAEDIAAAAGRHGVRILTINALQRFNHWDEGRAGEAEELIAYAAACGAEALILVPANDGTGAAEGERQDNLRNALSHLAPMLRASGVLGYVEPLGFRQCSLRFKSEAAAAIEDLGASDVFGLVHDTFHHHLAGEHALFPGLTRLIHISGVEDTDVSVNEMLDAHRVLVGTGDRLGNLEQLARLQTDGTDVPWSFEPFAAAVHTTRDIEGDLRASMNHILKGVAADRGARPERTT